MNLLEQALNHSPKRPFNSKVPTWDEVDLALAWVNEIVSTKQVSFVVKGTDKHGGGNALYYLATVLKRAHQLGMIKIDKIQINGTTTNL